MTASVQMPHLQNPMKNLRKKQQKYESASDGSCCAKTNLQDCSPSSLPTRRCSGFNRRGRVSRSTFGGHRECHFLLFMFSQGSLYRLSMDVCKDTEQFSSIWIVLKCYTLRILYCAIGMHSNILIQFPAVTNVNISLEVI